jgi:hypothetical protein
MQMELTSQVALSHVLWIGGGTDAGKTSVAKVLAQRHGLQLYHYDHHDLPQTQKLAETIPHYRTSLARPDEERWKRQMDATPQELMQRSLHHMTDRFPLVVEDLLVLPKQPMILAEGFGITPKFVLPFVSNPRQAIWLIPSEEFTWASMKRRNKPSWRNQVSDPERAFQNSFNRNLLLSAHFREEAVHYGLTVYEVEGIQTVEETADLIEQHFEPFLLGE